MEIKEFRPVFKQNLVVKKVLFVTGQKGDIFTVLEYNSCKTLKKYGVNANIFRTVPNINLAKGAKAEFEFDENLVPRLKKIIRPSEKPIIYPSNCSTCGSTLSCSKEGLKCNNGFCQAQSNGFTYKLISKALNKFEPDIDLNNVDRYLAKYPSEGSTINIDSFLEFTTVFKRIRDKNIAPIEKAWVSIYPLGDLAKTLFKIDCAVQRYLMAKKLKISDFWDICNFPKISQKQLDDLYKISPKDFIEGNFQLNQIKKLKTQNILFLSENHKFIEFLYNFLTVFENKEWEN